MVPTMAEEIEHTYLYKKIDSIEHRLESHVTKIEQRLDQLVHIMGAVASLQERETRNADAIKDIRLSIKDSFERFEKAIERLHGRLDSINKSIDQEAISRADTERTLDVQIKSVSGEVSKWRDRGIGLWLGLSLLVFVLQGFGGYMLKSVNEEYLITKAQIVEISKRQVELSHDVSKINSHIFKP